MDRPIPILMNLKAGALRAGPTHEEMCRQAEAAGLEADVLLVNTPDEMRDTVRRLVKGGAERLAVAGGDGTVRLAVQEMAHTNTALGILPQGTFNNFATALRLPQSLPLALRVLRDGQPVDVSVGRIDQHYFTEAAGVGLFADGLASYGAGTNKNFFRGLYSMGRVLFSMRPRRLRLTLDGKRIEDRAILCTVANTYRIAQGLPVAPDAVLTDDELDVVIVGDLSYGELPVYYRAMRAQLHLDLPKVTALRARSVRIETTAPMNVHADDRVLGETPVEIIAEPRALKVLVDRL